MSRSAIDYVKQMVCGSIGMMAAVSLATGIFTNEAAAIEGTMLERAKLATIGVLEDTQDQRTPDKPGKILVR